MLRGETRIDLVQDVLAVPQRPHLADRLVADARDDAADLGRDGVDGPALVVPVLLLEGQPQADGEALAFSS